MEPERINSTELRTKTRDLMERVKYNGEIFVVETFGRPTAVIMSVESFDRVKYVLSPISSRKTVSVKKSSAKRKHSRRKNPKLEGDPKTQSDLIGQTINGNDGKNPWNISNSSRSVREAK